MKNSAEIKWLDQAQSALWQQLNNIEDANFKNPIVSDEALENLLRPKGRRAAEIQEELRRGLLVRVIKELRKSYGRQSVEFFLLVKGHWFDFFCRELPVCARQRGPGVPHLHGKIASEPVRRLA